MVNLAQRKGRLVSAEREIVVLHGLKVSAKVSLSFLASCLAKIPPNKLCGDLKQFQQIMFHCEKPFC